MITDNATGKANLIHSWDIVTWWAVYAFLHMTNHRFQTSCDPASSQIAVQWVARVAPRSDSFRWDKTHCFMS